MQFEHEFTVDAPLATVVAFHRDTSALRRLTPLPIIAQIHEYEPLAEGSLARFTLWFGPLPVRWQAIHSDVSPNGFTDTQVSGPLKSWQHQHRFVALDARRTRVVDRVTYEHHAGWSGVISRLLFNRPGLTYLFTARKVLTRRHVARMMAAEQKPDGPTR
jgi:ligand-binding SRPBCC domain-containing protein